MTESPILHRGDIVTSIHNRSTQYKVLRIGAKRAHVRAIQTGYFACYCTPSILIIVKSKFGNQ